MANAFTIPQLHFYREPQNPPYSTASNFYNSTAFANGAWCGANDSGGSRDQWVNAVYSNSWGGEFWHYVTFRDVEYDDTADLNLASPPGSAQSVSVTHSTIAGGQANLAWKITTNNLTADDGGVYADSDTWWLTDDAPGSGNVLIKYGYTTGLLDVGNADVQEWFATRLLGILQNTITAGNASATEFGEALVNHITGIFLDDGNADNNGRADIAGTPTAVASAVGSSWTYYNDPDAWRDANRAFAQYIYENVCVPLGIKLMTNMQGTDFAAWKYWMDIPRSTGSGERIFDGCMIEFYATDSSGNHNNETDWYLTVQKQQYLEKNGQSAWCVAHGDPAGREAETGATITDNNHWAFCVATFALGWGPRSKFRYHSGSYGNAYNFDTLHSFLETYIGAPDTTTNNGEVSESSGTYTRVFQYCTVSVTPGNNTDGSATTATNSFQIAFDFAYRENSGGGAQTPTGNEGGGTWVENSTTTQPAQLTAGAFDTQVSYGPTVPNTIPRFALPYAVMQATGKETNTTTGYYDLEWTVGSLSAGDYPIWFLTAHDGAGGATGQIVMDLEVDGTDVFTNIDPVVDAGAVQTIAFYHDTATIADTDAIIKLQKVGSYDARVTALAVLPKRVTPAPVVAIPNEQVITVGDDVYLQVSATNPSGIGTLAYSVDSLPSGLSISSSTGLITGTVNPQAFTDVYEDTTVTVSNGTDSTDVTFRWWIIPGSLEAAIDCGGAGSTILVNGISTVVSADSSGSPYAGLTANGSLTSNGASPLTFLTDDTNTVPLWLRDEDTFQYYRYDSADPEMVYTVTCADQNQKMVIVGWMETGTSNRIFDVVINGSTVTSALNTYTVGGQYGCFTRRYVATPNGSNQITITFSNNPNTCRVNFIAIYDIQNDAPVLAAIGNQTDTVDVAISTVTASATDPGDTITYGATGLPTGLSINSSSGQITGTPTAVNTYNVTVTATDNRTPSKQDSEAFTWTINATSSAPIDRIPAVVVGRHRRRRWRN